MKPSFDIPLINQRVIQDRRSHPTSLVSALKAGGRERGFRRGGEGRNQYVAPPPSLRTIVLVAIIVVLSTLDAFFTIFHLKNGAFELNPLMEQLIQTDFQSALIIKSLGVGYMACFLAIHQNFRIRFYGLHISATIYVVLSVYHLAFYFLFQVV